MPKLKFKGTFYQGDGLKFEKPGLYDIPSEKKARQLVRDFPREWQTVTPEDEKADAEKQAAEAAKKALDEKALSALKNKMQEPGANKSGESESQTQPGTGQK